MTTKIVHVKHENFAIIITSHNLATLDCGLAARREPRAVPPPLPSPRPQPVCARRPSAPATCSQPVARPSPVRPRKPRPWPDSPMDYIDRMKVGNAIKFRHL